jgi:hypothetical protein
MRRLVIERLMGALVVVVVDVAGDFGTGLLNVLKLMEPGAFLFEGKERLNRSQRPFCWGV